MAINVSQAFHRTSANPVDESMALTKAQMLAVNDNLMPAYYFTICQDDGKIYLYNKTATFSLETGKFSVFEGGGSGSTYTAGDGINIINNVISTIQSEEGDMDEIIDELPSGGRVMVTGFTPIGTIISVFAESAPQHYLICDGSIYNKSDYPELAEHLLSLTTHSQYEVDGDNTKFKVPDLRGEFLRGTGTNGHTNQGNGENVGVHQDGTEIPVVGTQGTASTSYITGRSVMKDGVLTPTWYNAQDSIINTVEGSTAKNIRAQGIIADTGGNENAITTRPTNTSVLYCIATKNIYTNPMNDYSTDEKVVGTWIDGKPIYQKVVDMGSSPVYVSYNSWTDTGITISNGSQLVRCDCISTFNIFSSLIGYFDSSVLKAQTGRNGDTQDVQKFILQYTKTTD